MAIAYTTVFSHNGKKYRAFISKIEGLVNIHVPDQELHSVLPHGRFSFNPDKGFEINTPSLTEAQHLVITIISATELQHSNKINIPS